jgi:DNA-binding transcriptional LysR family regulator
MMTRFAFDPVLLSSFLAVAEAKSFTSAGRKLRLQQSTVSQHVKRLEDAVGRRLFIRDTHSVKLTHDGAAMLEFAKRILEIEHRAKAYFAASSLRGRIRLGVSEDFVLSRLSIILRRFMQRNPSVDLELSVGLADSLYEKLGSGELDLLFSNRRKGDDRGGTVWHEKLVWIGSPDFEVTSDRPLPLVTFPPPSITRMMAIDAVENAGLNWRVTCVSQSLSGIWSAVEAGLGISAQSRHLSPDTLNVLPFSPHLPELGEVEYVVVSATRVMSPPVEALASLILEKGAGLDGNRVTPLPLSG